MYVIIVYIGLIIVYIGLIGINAIIISNEKFSSLSSLALIHKSIKFTTVLQSMH